MNTNIRRGLVAAAIAGIALTGLAACSADNDSSMGESTSSSASLVGPITADLSSINGTTIDATVGRTIDLTGDDKTFDQWTATESTPGIVTFTKGYTSGGTSYNPGLTVDAAGKTDVTLTNASTGEKVTFTVNATK